MASGFPENTRLAAIDVDGTLVDLSLVVSDLNRRAVARLQRAGIEVVLASGRHYETLRPFADVLPGVKWLVAAQGGDVTDLDRENVLTQVFLDDALARRVVALGRSLGFFVALYTEEGIFVDDDAKVMGFYTRLAGRAPRRRTTDWLAQRLLKIVWIGEAEKIMHASGRPELDAFDLERVRTHQQLFEFSPRGVTKASGLEVLVKHLGFGPSEVIVFGDAENDISMFDWARTSVAMPHGWPEALRRATFVAPPGSSDSALARGINLLFDHGRSTSC